MREIDAMGPASQRAVDHVDAFLFDFSGQGDNMTVKRMDNIGIVVEDMSLSR